MSETAGILRHQARDGNVFDHSNDTVVVTRTLLTSAADEIERLTLENWQLKGALGYPVPGNIPQGPFKCGLCDARNDEQPAPEGK